MQLKDLDKYIIEDIESDDHPSDFIKRDKYFGLILRLPKKEDKVKIKSYAFLVQNGEVYQYNRDKKDIELLGSIDMLQKLLEPLVEKLIRDIKQYHINVDKLEENLYEGRVSNTFMQDWLQYKKDVSLINRLMFHASIVMELFISHLKREYNNKFNVEAFDDLHEEISRVRDLAKACVEKLDNLYDFYRAKVDEKMNKNVYYLTLLSGIFLPLTLATGFFGMNTGGLPFTDDSMGTWKVVAISLVLEVIFFVPLILQNSRRIKKR